MSQTQKHCADCQHLRIHPQQKRHGALCASAAFAPNPVTGDPAQNCEIQRSRPDGKCGAEGKLFEPRDPTTWMAWVSREGPLLDAGLTVERREVEALLNPAKTMLFANAVAGNARAVQHAQATIKTLQCLLDGTGKQYADYQDSKGGYEAAAAFKSAWSPLPKGIENFSLPQVQQFLRSHGVEIPTDALSDSQINGVLQLKNGALPMVDLDNKHNAARADLDDGPCLHNTLPVEAAIVAQGGAA